MRAGRLRHMVKIQSQSAQASTEGGLVTSSTTWTTDATVWAARTDERGSEGFEAGRRQADRRTTWTIRETTAISPSKRIVDGASTADIYDIVAVRSRGQMRFQEVETILRGD